MQQPLDFLVRRATTSLNRPSMDLSKVLVHGLTICQAIKKIGCVPSSVDHLVFTMHKDSSSMALIVYVDDILIAGSDKMVLKIQTASPTLSL